MEYCTEYDREQVELAECFRGQYEVFYLASNLDFVQVEISYISV